MRETPWLHPNQAVQGADGFTMHGACKQSTAVHEATRMCQPMTLACALCY